MPNNKKLSNFMSASQKEALKATLDFNNKIESVLDSIKRQSGLGAFKKNNECTYSMLLKISNLQDKTDAVNAVNKALSLVKVKTNKQEMVGHLRYALPRLSLVIPYNPYYYEKALSECSFSIINLMVDNGLIKHEVEKPRMVTLKDGSYTFVRHSYVYRPNHIEYKEPRKGGKRRGILIKGTTKKLKYTQFERQYLEDYNQLLEDTVQVKERHSSLADIYFELILLEELEAQNDKPHREARANIKARLAKYREEYDSMLGNSHEFNPWLDSRARNYYGLTDIGVNPHGDAYEKYHWECVDEYVLNERAIEILQIACVRTIHGKLTEKVALKKYEPSMIDELQKPLKMLFMHLNNLYSRERLDFLTTYGINKKQFGELVHNYELGNELKKSVGDTSRWIHYRDMTNQGLMTFSINFKSSKGLKLVNLKDQRKVFSSHKEIKDGIDKFINKDWTIKEFKQQVSQSLFHGGRAMGIAKKLGIDESLFHDGLVDSIGQEYQAMEQIADWGSYLPNVVSWKTSDGFTARHTNYVKSMKMKIYGLNESKTGYTSMAIYQDMPLMRIGGQIVSSDDKSTENKGWGLYANITHSFEPMRKIIQFACAKKIPFIGIHDNYGQRLVDVDIVIGRLSIIIQDDFKRGNEYERVSNQLSKYYGLPKLELIKPTKEAKSINKNARNFLIE